MLLTQRAAVIGHPIGHTMSPFLQERLFALQGIPMTYQVLDLPDLAGGLPALRQLDCFNVTIPHKSGILSYLDQIDEKARACGSVNTVRVREGKFSGTTTDGVGCFKALARHGLDFSGNLLLLGNGGAARAVAFEIAACQPVFSLTIAHRAKSRDRAEALAMELVRFAQGRGDRGFWVKTQSYPELEDACRAGDGPRFDLLLNTTSVGMLPQAGISPVSGAVTARCAAVFDAVYNPAETQLLRLAKESGAKTVGGMEMLVYQAVAAHEFWYGSRFREEDLDRLCQDAAREMEKRFAR